MVYVFLAQGFETIEALTVVDILRRGKVEVATVSITDSLMVESAQKIAVQADLCIADIEEDAKMYVLPGGIPGTPNLKNCAKVMECIKKQYEKGGYIAAICAAPSIFAELGYLEGKEAIAYPDYEEVLSQNGASVVRKGAVVAGNVITGRAMGTAIDFGLAILSVLAGESCAKQVADAIVYE